MERIYTLRDWEETRSLLDEFNVAYVFVGGLENTTYDASSFDKFEANMEVVFANDGVTIYGWRGSG